jgi:TatD DNase family protein
MKNLYSDSHCHLEGVYDKRVINIEKTDEVIQNSKKLGFVLLLTSGIDMDTSRQSIVTANRYDIAKACVGIHPWFADEYNENSKNVLKKLAKDHEVVAISEIGLDYFGRWTKKLEPAEGILGRETQQIAFIEQLELAEELNLPVLIHDKAVGQEVFDILENEKIQVGVAIHGFSRGMEYAERAVDMGVYLSVGPRILKADPPEIIEAVIHTPITKILTETDIEKPDDVLKIVKRVAELKDLTVEEVAIAATQNLKQLIKVQ